MRRTRSAALCVVGGFLAATCGGCAAASSDQQITSHVGQGTYQGYGGTAIVGADGRTITVGSYPAEDCPRTITPVARESATQVALFLEYVMPPNPPLCRQAAVALVDARDITLREPLGNRKLIDGATSQAIGRISAGLVLRLTALPVGYRLSDFIPAVDLSRAQSLGPAGASQIYDSLNSADALIIKQSAGSLRVPGPGPGGWTSIRVRGHPGRATRNLITWRENGLTDLIVVGAQNGPDEPQVLSTQQLIAIADSASAYNSGPIPIVGNEAGPGPPEHSVIW